MVCVLVLELELMLGKHGTNQIIFSLKEIVSHGHFWRQVPGMKYRNLEHYF